MHTYFTRHRAVTAVSDKLWHLACERQSFRVLGEKQRRRRRRHHVVVGDRAVTVPTDKFVGRATGIYRQACTPPRHRYVPVRSKTACLRNHLGSCGVNRALAASSVVIYTHQKRKSLKHSLACLCVRYLGTHAYVSVVFEMCVLSTYTRIYFLSACLCVGRCGPTWLHRPPPRYVCTTTVPSP